MNNKLEINYTKLYKFIKDKNIYNLFTYKYFISDNFESTNPPLFYIEKNYKNHYNMLVYQLLIRQISKNYNIKDFDIDENNSYILNHNWKGNVRELRNLIERIAILQPETKDKISNIIKE